MSNEMKYSTPSFTIKKRRKANSVQRAIGNALVNSAKRLRFRKQFSGNKPHYFKRSFDGTAITGLAARVITQGAGTANYAWYFKLDMLTSYTEFTSLFDEYQITKIVFKIIPLAIQTSVPTAGPVNSGLIAGVVDYDDSNALTNFTDYQQYHNFKVQAIGNLTPLTFVWRPRFAGAAYGGAFTRYTSQDKVWLDCVSADIQHYGLKIYLDAYASAGTAASFQVMGTLYMKFRNVR